MTKDMKQLEEFLQFMMDHKSDDRVSIFKDIKYGHRNYYIVFDIDKEPDKNYISGGSWSRNYRGTMTVRVDGRNQCIMIGTDEAEAESVIFESKELVEKWSEIIENHISSGIMGRFSKMVERTFSRCHRKDISRDWKMKKILKADEPIHARRNRKNKQD